MGDVIRLVGPQRAVEIFGVQLVGLNAENGKKLLLTFGLAAVLMALGWMLRRLATWALHERNLWLEFWARQVIQLSVALLVLLGTASIWFDDPARLATALGLVTAGLAFALQKVVTALAGYAVILRGKTFGVGDRITIGEVRGDVIALSLTQTTVMEMGQPPADQASDPAMWVKSRQYTGRVVTVSNARIFDEPVYNYTRDFPFIWEEMVLPLGYGEDRARAEQILLDVAERHTVPIRELSAEALAELQRRYFAPYADIKPRVFWRLTENWLELTVRFLVRDHGIRSVKDQMSREVLGALDAAGIQVAPQRLAIVGAPTSTHRE